MSEMEEYSDWQPISSGNLHQVSLKSKGGPYDQSLPGEYARLLLILVAVPLLVWFACGIFTLKNSVVSLLSAVFLLACLISTRGYVGIRIGLLLLMTVNILSVVVNADYIVAYGEKKISQVPNYILFGCLCMSLLFETSFWFSNISRKNLFKLALWGLFGIPALVYVIGIPVFQLVSDHIYKDEINFALRDPDWKFWNEVNFRASQFAIFSLFTYMGACVGSFLNVVGYCVPKGEPIGLRDSECPSCNSRIARVDNLPIFSYLNLNGRCRTCQFNIPVRYLLAELVVATIFGSLFLYELISGCRNVPSLYMSYKGILWVILYPKWPAIAIYFYHAFFMSSLLVFSIFELDRQRLKVTFAFIVASVFFAAPLMYWPIHPVSITDHLPLKLEISPWIAQTLKMVVGGFIGSFLGFVFGAIDVDSRSVHFRFSFALTGLVLGWQAVLQIFVVFMVLRAALKLVSRDLATRLDPLPTAVLLTAIMIHQPFWQYIAYLWD